MITLYGKRKEERGKRKEGKFKYTIKIIVSK
jgi:hypothetical protein